MKFRSILSPLFLSFSVTGCVTHQDVEPQPLSWKSPVLEAPMQDGGLVNLKAVTSGPWAVVFFYPKADTPGRVKQVKSLRSVFETLSQFQIQVIGVSVDSVAEQKAFADKFALPFPLLSDGTEAICDAYRVERPRDRPRRETFIFRKGRLVSHDRAVPPRTQANDVLRKIEELSTRYTAAHQDL